MLKKITVVTLAIALTACANTDALDESIASLTNKVDALSAQVADLEAQQKSTAADAKSAKKEAKQAAELAAQAAVDAKATNERIDNVVSSYKK